MATMNFYVSIGIDGRATRLEGGPRSKDGGLEGTIMIRDRGARVKAARISAGADSEGNLYLRIAPGDVQFRTCADGSIVIECKR